VVVGDPLVTTYFITAAVLGPSSPLPKLIDETVDAEGPDDVAAQLKQRLGEGYTIGDIAYHPAPEEPVVHHSPRRIRRIPLAKGSPAGLKTKALYKFSSELIVEARSRREAEGIISRAYATSSASDAEVGTAFRELHPSSWLRSSVVIQQPCCGMEAPGHTPDCPAHGIPLDQRLKGQSLPGSLACRSTERGEITG
jgi:hypothetical protein